MLLDPVEPLGDQGAEQLGLLVRQRVAGPVEHGERRTRVLVEKLPRPRIADGGVLAPGQQERRAAERTSVLGTGGQVPPLADPLQCGLVRQPGTRLERSS